MKNSKFLRWSSFAFFLLIAFLFILFLRHNIICRYVILYGLIASGGAFLSVLSGKRIEETIPLNLLIVFFVCYLFGLFGYLRYGIYAISLISFCEIIYMIFKIDGTSLKKIVTPGFLLYSVLFLVLAISTFKAGFQVWDEYTYWSIASKNMFYLDDFLGNPSSTLNFIPYPPNPTLYHYIFCKVIGVYSQGIELFSYMLSGFAFLLPILKKTSFNKKTIIYNFSFLLAIVFIPSIFINSLFYMSIYADTILGLIMGYILLIIFKEEKTKLDYISLFLSMGLISLTKATGIVIALIIIIGVIIYGFIKSSGKLKRFIKSYLMLILLLITSLVLSYGTWTLYIKNNLPVVNGNVSNVARTDSSKLLSDYIILTGENFYGNDYDYRNFSLTTFYKDICDYKIYNVNPVPLSYMSWLIIFAFCFVLLYKLSDNKKDFIAFSISLLIIVLIYTFFIEMSYLDVFSESDATSHASIQRYLGTILVCLIMIVTALFARYFNVNSKINNLLFILCILLCTPIEPITNITINNGYYNYMINSQLYPLINITDKVKDKVTSDSRIFTIHQTSMYDTYALKFRYYMTPQFVPEVDPLGVYRVKTNIHVNSIGELSNELYNEYDYVMILQLDENFYNEYASLFEGEIKEWSLYAIKKNNKKHSVSLVKVEL